MKILTYLCFILPILGFSQNAEELNKKSLDLLQNGKYDEAVPILRESAKLGNSQAQYNLGYCYEYGVGMEKDLKLAAEWYNKSADQEYNDGLYAMMMANAEGKGVPLNYHKAFQYALKCANNNDATCMLNVVNAYKDGLGTVKSTEKMLEWAIKLGKLENPENLQKSGRITSARLNLAYMYRDGTDVKRDLLQSYIWFLLYNESKRDFSVIQQKSVLSEIMEVEKQLTPQDIEKAKSEAEKLSNRSLKNLINLYRADFE